MKGMPILKDHQGEPRLEPIPWDVIAPHEAQAQRNHYQSLERLAERGGLSVCEAVAILEDRAWHKMDQVVALEQLTEIVHDWLSG